MVKNKKLITFSLWGKSRLYCEGAKLNIVTSAKYLKDYKCRFYIAKNCPVLPELQKMDCETVILPAAEGVIRDDGCKWHKNPNLFLMMARYLAFADPSADYIISRDTDSRITPRDTICIREWEESGALAHQISENELHFRNGPMGGMVGVMGGLFPNIQDMMNQYLEIFPKIGEPPVFSDIIFLRDVLFPQISYSVLRHGYGGKPIPKHESIPAELGEYIGQVINEEWRNQEYIPNE